VANFFASSDATTGTGSDTNPFGPGQLYTATGRPGPAQDAMKRGDRMYFKGEFNIRTGPGSTDYSYGVLAPPATDCTFQAWPGFPAPVFRRISGLSPLFGTYRRNDFIAHRTHFLGLEFREAIGPPGVNPCLLMAKGKKGGTTTPNVYVEGVEVGWCKGVMNSATGTDNHDIIRMEYTRGLHIHHCEGTGATGTGWNSAWLKGYESYDVLVEDCYIHGNDCGIYAKTSVYNMTVQRCLFADNKVDSGTPHDLVLPGYHGGGPFFIYDNILANYVEGAHFSDGGEIHHNIVTKGDHLFWQTASTSHTWKLWNNILLSTSNAVKPFAAPYTVYPGSPPSLAAMSHNLYASRAGGTPSATYPYKGVNYTLTQFNNLGFDKSSRRVSGGLPAIFADPATFTLKPEFRAMGRDGDTVGPGHSNNPRTGKPITTAEILDIGRYGPAAMSGQEPPPPPPPPDPDPDPDPVEPPPMSFLIVGGSSRGVLIFNEG
jgi:hypothetical protein